MSGEKLLSRRSFFRLAGASALAVIGAKTLDQLTILLEGPQLPEESFIPYPNIGFLWSRSRTEGGVWPDLLNPDNGPANFIQGVTTADHLFNDRDPKNPGTMQSVFGQQIIDLAENKPAPLLGDAIQNHFNLARGKLAHTFPDAGYAAEKDVLRAAVDLAILSLAASCNPFLKYKDVREQFGVTLPESATLSANSKWLHGIYPTNPAVYPAPDSECDDETDAILRCKGQIDRFTHFTFHQVIAWYAQQYLNNDQLVSLLQYGVGRYWEIDETRKAIEKYWSAPQNWSKITKTGLLENNVNFDEEANFLGRYTAGWLTGAKNLSDYEQIFQHLNCEAINKPQKRLQILPSQLRLVLPSFEPSGGHP